MTAVYCFSGSGHSMAVARELARLLSCGVVEIGFDTARAADCAVVVFPVYCQNIPGPVKSFLKTLRAKHIALVATYGKISCGNVLYEARKIVSGQVIAGACIPMGHTFLDGDHGFDPAFLLPIAERISTPRRAPIPRMPKESLADVFPALRSRMGVKIVRTDRCTDCGLCEKRCPMGAIRNGRPNHKCIRCLRCVTECPQKALRYENRWILQKYLEHHRREEYSLYL